MSTMCRMGRGTLVRPARLIDTFFELVKIDSETKNERRICDVLMQEMRGLGLQVAEDDSAGTTGHGAGNIVATLPGVVPGSPVIFFTGHMDTVAPGKAIAPSIEGEYIVSDGTTILGSDDKAGLAAFLEAIRVLSESGEKHGTVQFIITAGEELGFAGSRAIDRSLIEADYGFALDANGPVGDIIVAAPAQVKLSATITGKSARAGVNQGDGISAIQVASKAVARMPLGRIDSETTANIEQFAGGGGTNVARDCVAIVAEVRSLCKQKMRRQLYEMKAAFETTAHEHGATALVEVETMCHAYRFSREDTLVKHAERAVRRIGRKARLRASSDSSDANVFSSMGLPTVNLGIGYEHIHTTKERIRTEELIKAAELVVALVQEAGKS